MDPQAVLALCHEHAHAEAAFDIDRVLATVAPEPLYEFHPSGRTLSGWPTIEHFYRSQYPVFVTQVTGFELLGEWANERAAIQEYVIGVGEGSVAADYRVVSIMPVDDATGLLSGERLYCDEAFARRLLGPLWEDTQPVG